MRFLIYILLVLTAAVFFLVNAPANLDPTAKEPGAASSTPSMSAETTPTAATPTPPAKAAAAPDEPQPQTPPMKTIDPRALEEIQQSLNRARQTLTELEKAETPQPLKRLTQAELYAKASQRVVNFFCQLENQARLASGVIISPAGHILTNAHVAAGLPPGYECMIRQGSPARGFSYAEVVMFPQTYVNAASRQEQADNDVSIWKITRSSGGDPLPDSFPFYEINPGLYPQENEILATFSYPSELLGYETALKSLNLLFAETVVSDFDRDIILSGAGLSSQIGSSGGVLVNIYTNDFAGLIFGVSKDETINQRQLFSLTPYSIDRVVKTETGLPLADLLIKAKP